MADYYKSIYSGAQIDTSLGRIINGELDTAVDGANAAAGRAESAATAIQSAIDNLPVGAVPVIDDLTTGGRTVALSAEQGKELNVEVDAAQAVAASALEASADHTGRTDNPHGLTAQQIGAIPTAEKGAPNGVAPLDGDGKLPAGNLLLPGKNRLDNACFLAPYLENQRGRSSYTTTGYTIDRFRIYLPAGGSLTVSSGGVVLSATTGALQFLQDVSEPYSNLANKTMTASAEIGGTIYSASGVLVEGAPITKALPNGVSLIFGKQSNRTWAQFIVDVPARVSVPVSRVKLELGSVSTLHLDTPPSPAEQELNRQVCKRYYQRIPTLYAYGHCATATDAYVAVPVPVPMRITPSIIVENNGALNFGATVVAPVGLSVAASNDNQVHIGVGGSGMTPNAPCVLHDATIALSADL